MIDAPTPGLYQRGGSEPRAEAERVLTSCPVARSEAGEWIILGHREVVETAHRNNDFSSATSRFLQIPNGLDGDLHAAYRSIVDRFFTTEEMRKFEPRLHRVVRATLAEIAGRATEDTPHVTCDAVNDIGAVAAVRAQIAWLGWHSEVEEQLLAWMKENHAATRSGELSRTAAVAEHFNGIIRKELDHHRGLDASADVTSRLMNETVTLPGGTQRALYDKELVSILRNWTGGDLGSIALCIGVLTAGFVAQPRIAECFVHTPEYAEKAAIVDEFLRLDNPFVSNRRVATCDTEIAGVKIRAGERLRLNWTGANLDPRVFDDPHAFAPKINREKNLVYGTGRHVCPGRPLATLELVTVMEELFTAFSIELVGEPEREVCPLGGFAHLPVRLTPRTR